MSRKDKGVFVGGARASGKSTVLRCLAHEFQLAQKIVYYVPYADLLNHYTTDDIDAMEASLPEGVYQYVFIDEISQLSGILGYLLKESTKTFVIGCGMPGSRGSRQFNYKIDTKELALTERIVFDPAEMFLTYFESLSTLPNEKLLDVLKWFLVYTGGHIYAFVLFCQAILTDEMFIKRVCCCEDYPSFNQLMHCEVTALRKLGETGVYGSATIRCYNNREISIAGRNLLRSCFKDYVAFDKLNEAGWIGISDTGSFCISPMFETYLLNDFEIFPSNKDKQLS